MDNYLVLNGKRIELTEEQVKILKKNPFERQDSHKTYYHITDCGAILADYEINFMNDKQRYSVANYCTDKSLMEQRALHETLNRLLWRFSMEHDGDKIDWTKCIDKYVICFSYEFMDYTVNAAYQNVVDGVVYFYTKKIAQQAIEEIVKPFMEQHPEFVW